VSKVREEEEADKPRSNKYTTKTPSVFIQQREKKGRKKRKRKKSDGE